MDPGRLINQIVKFFDIMKATVCCHQEVKNNLEEIRIQGIEVRESKNTEIKSQTQTLWTDERTYNEKPKEKWE